MQLDKPIQSRKSVKKFKSKEPDWRDIIECIDATRYAPMAGGHFTPRFILVNEEESIQKIANACQQSFVAQTKYLVVACSNPGTTSKNFEDGEKFVRQQAGAAIQNFLLKIQEKNLSTCWVGYFNEKEIKRELKIPDSTNVEAVFPIGYEYRKEKPKRKIELDRILYFFKWGNKQMKKIKQINA